MANKLITKREILFSVVIISVMLALGFLISSNISNALMDDYQQYNTALQINNDKNVFRHGMKTNIGNAFVYSDLCALDPVSFDEIEGSYSHVKKVKERNTRHTRTVTKSRINAQGKTETYTETETYYTWDYVNREVKNATTISFCGVSFDYGTIEFPSEREITTVYQGNEWWHSVGDVRYVYYGSPIECRGTLYALLENNSISNVHFYYDSNIKETINSLESEWQLILFWVIWIIVIIGLTIGFYYLNNKWLES